MWTIGANRFSVLIDSSYLLSNLDDCIIYNFTKSRFPSLLPILAFFSYCLCQSDKQSGMGWLILYQDRSPPEHILQLDFRTYPLHFQASRTGLCFKPIL